MNTSHGMTARRETDGFGCVETCTREITQRSGQICVWRRNPCLTTFSSIDTASSNRYLGSTTVPNALQSLAALFRRDCQMLMALPNIQTKQSNQPLKQLPVSLVLTKDRRCQGDGRTANFGAHIRPEETQRIVHCNP